MVFYNEKQTVLDNDSFSPSAGKPAKVVASWKALGLPVAVRSFRPSSIKQISKIHDPSYVKGVLSCTQDNGFHNRLKSVADALPWVCGSMVAAAVHAAETKEICASPTSGSHHATYSHGGGFCTFGSLVLGAVEVLEKGLARKVGIFDVDAHAGNGTKDIIEKLDLNISHWSLGYSDVRSDDAEAWLKALPKFLKRQFKGCSLIIYNAGMDSFINDPLGGVFTVDQIRRRDRIVFEYCKKHKKGCAFALAGGYQEDIRKILDLHDITMQQACSVSGLI